MSEYKQYFSLLLVASWWPTTGLSKSSILIFPPYTTLKAGTASSAAATGELLSPSL